MSWLGLWGKKKEENEQKKINIIGFVFGNPQTKFSYFDSIEYNDSNINMVINKYAPLVSIPKIETYYYRNPRVELTYKVIHEIVTTTALSYLQIRINSNTNFRIFKAVFPKIKIQNKIKIPSEYYEGQTTEYNIVNNPIVVCALNNYTKVRLVTNNGYTDVDKSLSNSRGTLIFVCEELYINNEEGSEPESSDIFDNDNKKINISLIPDLNEFTYDNSRNNVQINKILTMNQKKEGYPFVLLVSGEIPIWVYDELLPLSTKGYINATGQPVSSSYTGTKYHIERVNDCFTNISSSINFGTRKDIDLSSEKWDGVFIKDIYISRYYENKTKPFYYWQGTQKVESIIHYIDDPETEDIENVILNTTGQPTLEIQFSDQNEVNFLDKYVQQIKIGSEFKNVLVFDLAGIPDFNSVIEEANEWNLQNIIVTLNKLIIRKEGDQFSDSFTSEIIENIQIKYINSENENCILEFNAPPSCSLNNLYCINTSEMVLDDTIYAINLDKKVPYEHLYLTNLRGSSSVTPDSVNLVVSGDITAIYTGGLPEGVDTINAPPVPGDVLEEKTCMNLINYHNSTELKKEKFGSTENGNFHQTVFVSFILAYDTLDIRNKLDNFDLKSSNSNMTVDKNESEDLSETTYLDTQIRYERDDIVYDVKNDRRNTYLYIKREETNNFLTTREEDENGTIIKYTDIFLDKNMSFVFRKFPYLGISLIVEDLILTNQYKVTFNGIGEMGKLRIYYYESDQSTAYQSEVPGESTYLVNNLYIFSGKLKVDPDTQTKMLIPQPVDWSENDTQHHVFNINSDTKQISIDLPVSADLEEYVSIQYLYCINTIITNNSDLHIRFPKLNLVVSGNIPQWVYEQLLPLPKLLHEDGLIDEYNNQVYGIQLYSINAPSIYGISGVNEENESIYSELDLTNLANSNSFNRIYSIDDEELMDFYVNKIKLLERFRGTNLPFRQVVNNEIIPTDYTFVHDLGMYLTPMDEIEQPDEDGLLTLTVQIPARNGILNDLVVLNDPDDIYLGGSVILDLSRELQLNEGSKITQLKYQFEDGIFFSNDIYGGIVNFQTGIAFVGNGIQPESTKVMVANPDGFFQTWVIQNTGNLILCNIKYLYLIETEIEEGQENSSNIKTIVPENATSESKQGILDWENVIILNKISCSSYYGNLEGIIEYYLTNCMTSGDLPVFINLVIKGDIPEWLYGHLPLGENFRLKPNGRITHKSETDPEEEDPDWDKYPKVVSINAIPYPGLEIDNLDADNQCSMDLSQVLKEDEN